MRFKKVISTILVGAMAVGLVACGSSTTSSSASGDTGASADSTSADIMTTAEAATDDSEPQYGGELNMYWQEFYNSYDPSIYTNRNYAMWYEQLWTIDWSLNDSDTFGFNTDEISMDYMQGQIADTWEFDADAQTLTVNLRDDVYFQQKDGDYDIYGGRNLTSADVKWSYDRLLGIDGATQVDCEQNWADTLYMLESVECPDDYTVVFHFNTGSEVAESDFITANVNIGGSEWDTLTDDQKSDWHYAAGTGPYIITDYVADSYMTLSKNENYYDYDERYPENKLPYIDTINLIEVADTSNLLSQFIAGDLDIVGWSASTLNDSEIQQVVDSMEYGDFYVNSVKHYTVGLALKQCYEPFQDVRVREALQMAIDLKTITTDYYGYDESDLSYFGIFAPTTEYSSVSEWDDDLLATYEYDPEAAKELLTEAGYPDGFEFDVTLFAAQDVDLYTYVAAELAQIGVTMNITTVSTPQEMQAVGTDLTNPSSISGTQCLPDVSDAIDGYTTDAPYNNMGLSDSTLDEMLDAANAADTLEEKVELAKKADLYAAEQHYTLQFSPVEKIKQYFSSRVEGYTGENIYKDFNATTVLSRIWLNDNN